MKRKITKEQKTNVLEVSLDEARVLLAALEQEAYLASGSGNEARAEIAWGIFRRLEIMQFGKSANAFVPPFMTRVTLIKTATEWSVCDASQGLGFVIAEFDTNAEARAWAKRQGYKIVTSAGGAL